MIGLFVSSIYHCSGSSR